MGIISFTFSILRNDNTLYLIKGSNPLAIYHFPTIGIYVYASTAGILNDVLGEVKKDFPYEEIELDYGEILQINPDGTTKMSAFCTDEYADLIWYGSTGEQSEELKEIYEYCGWFGVSKDDIELLLDYGYDTDTIKDMLMDSNALKEALTEAKNIFEI